MTKNFSAVFLAAALGATASPAAAILTSPAVSISLAGGSPSALFNSANAVQMSFSAINTASAAGTIVFTFTVTGPTGATVFSQTGNSAPGSAVGRVGAALNFVPLIGFAKTAGTYRLTGTATNGADTASNHADFEVRDAKIVMQLPRDGDTAVFAQPIRFQWEHAASSYRLEMAKDEAFEQEIFSTLVPGAETYEYNQPSPVDTFKSLAADQKYFWRVRGLDLAGNVIASPDKPFLFYLYSPSLPVSSAGDLGITGMTAGAPNKLTETVPVTVTVKNFGVKAESEITVQGSATDDARPITLSVDPRTITSIAPGESVDVDLSVPFFKKEKGPGQVTVQALLGGGFRDANEANNFFILHRVSVPARNAADYCASSPCRNGGACTNAGSAYVCACPEGYAGTDCQISQFVPAGETCAGALLAPASTKNLSITRAVATSGEKPTLTVYVKNGGSRPEQGVQLMPTDYLKEEIAKNTSPELLVPVVNAWISDFKASSKIECLAPGAEEGIVVPFFLVGRELEPKLDAVTLGFQALLRHENGDSDPQTDFSGPLVVSVPLPKLPARSGIWDLSALSLAAPDEFVAGKPAKIHVRVRAPSAADLSGGQFHLILSGQGPADAPFVLKGDGVDSTDVTLTKENVGGVFVFETTVGDSSALGTALSAVFTAQIKGPLVSKTETGTFTTRAQPLEKKTCADLVCENGGACRESGAGPVCICAAGYYGATCGTASAARWSITSVAAVDAQTFYKGLPQKVSVGVKCGDDYNGSLCARAVAVRLTMGSEQPVTQSVQGKLGEWSVSLPVTPNDDKLLSFAAALTDDRDATKILAGPVTQSIQAHAQPAALLDSVQQTRDLDILSGGITLGDADNTKAIVPVKVQVKNLGFVAEKNVSVTLAATKDGDPTQTFSQNVSNIDSQGVSDVVFDVPLSNAKASATLVASVSNRDNVDKDQSNNTVTKEKVAIPGVQVCSVGTYRTPGGCSVCAPGTFAAVADAEACSPCAKGFYANVAGSMLCSRCPAGTVSKEGAASCAPCNGTASADSGSCSTQPIGGPCTVSPSEGTASDTMFNLAAGIWAGDTPLSYQWTVGGAIIGAASSDPTLASKLPPTQSVKLRVSDSNGGYTDCEAKVTVLANGLTFATQPAKAASTSDSVTVTFKASGKGGTVRVIAMASGSAAPTAAQASAATGAVGVSPAASATTGADQTVKVAGLQPGTAYDFYAALDGKVLSNKLTASTLASDSVASLRFAAQPGYETTGVLFAVQPTVVAYKSASDVDSTRSEAVTLTLVPLDPCSKGTLTATPTAMAMGVAAFTGVKVNLPGQYTLKASAAGLAPAESQLFKVFADAAAAVTAATVEAGAGACPKGFYRPDQFGGCSRSPDSGPLADGSTCPGASKLVFTTQPAKTASTSDSVTVTFKASGTGGMVRVIALARGSAAPTAAQVSAGTGAVGVSPAASATTGADQTVAVTGLQPGTAYDFYAALDGQVLSNALQAQTDSRIIFATKPTLARKTTDSITVTFKATGSGDKAIAVAGLTVGNARESTVSAFGKASKSHFYSEIEATTGADQTLTVSGLRPGPQYDVYTYLQGSGEFWSVPGVSLPSPLTFTKTPAKSAATSDSVKLTFRVSSGGKVTFKAVNKGSTAPTADEVLSGGTQVAARPGSDLTVKLSGLSPATSYEFYAVLENNAALAGPFAAETSRSTKLYFHLSPNDAFAGDAPIRQPWVKAIDEQGKIVATGETVTLSLKDASDPAPLTAAPMAMTNGSAQFSGVSISKPGKYKLVATANGFDPVESLPFTIKAESFRSTLGRSLGTQDSITLAFQTNGKGENVRVIALPSGHAKPQAAAVFDGTDGVGTAPEKTPSTGGLQKMTVTGLSPSTSYDFYAALESGAVSSVLRTKTNAITIAKIAFQVQPSGAIAGKALTTQPVVVALDAKDQAVPETGLVNLTLQAGAGSLTAAPARMTGGVAKFTDVAIDKAGDGHVLFAAMGDFTAQSDPFSVAAPACAGAYSQVGYEVSGCGAGTASGTVCTAVCAPGYAGAPAGTVACAAGNYSGAFSGCVSGDDDEDSSDIPEDSDTSAADAACVRSDYTVRPAGAVCGTRPVGTNKTCTRSPRCSRNGHCMPSSFMRNSRKCKRTDGSKGLCDGSGHCQ